ncbi:SAP domain-containing protein [Anaerovorax sp. IOR16]|uniref:SAP domain-containing protein n=1 Tax=Anaerovorax sp. IOR16 TaxID=2773458 RepID=UPI0019CF8372|nr:SAP domain-containing protein [Anaerovorax sp. IOR16]
MYVLKLTKGLSCKAGKVRATKEKPFCEVADKKTALQAVNTGYFAIVKETGDETPNSNTPIEKMTVAECKVYAEEHNIDIKGLSKVGELRQRITEALEPDSETPNSNDKDLEPDMGEE